MLKGHVKIELTDVNTGEKQVVEGDNMITDAVNTLKRLKLYGEGTDSRNLYSTFMGGIMLFDDTLNTTGEHLMQFPHEAHFLGSGYHATNTNNALCGSFNSLESGWSTNNQSFTQVWDFNTSQANGNIKSLALSGNTTQTTGGSKLHNCRYLNTPDDYIVYNSWDRCVAIVDDYAYKIWGSDANKLYIAKVKTNLAKVHIYDAILSYQTVGNTTLTDSCFYDDRPRNCFPFYNENDGYLYFSRIKYPNYLYIVKVRLTDPSDTQVISTQCEDCTFYTDDSTSTSNVYFDHSQVTDNYVYVLKNTRTAVYKINLNNLMDIAEIALPRYVTYNNGVMSQKIAVFRTGWDSAVNYKYRCVAIYPDGTVLYDELANLDDNDMEYTTPIGDLYAAARNTSSKLYIIGNYCATRYNLPSPVQKTSAQSMKITYTISDVLEMSIVTQPSKQDVILGNDATFSVTVVNDQHTAENPTQYQWQYFTRTNGAWTDCTGSTATTNSYTFTPILTDNGRAYRCVITDNAGTVCKTIPASLYVTTS